MNWYKHATVTVTPKDNTTGKVRNENMFGIKVNLEKQLEKLFPKEIASTFFRIIHNEEKGFTITTKYWNLPTGTIQVEVTKFPPQKLNAFIEATKRILTEMNLEFDDNMPVVDKLSKLYIGSRYEEVMLKVFLVHITTNHNAKDEFKNINDMFCKGKPPSLTLSDEIAKKIFNILNITNEIPPINLMAHIESLDMNDEIFRSMSPEELSAIQRLYELAQFAWDYNVQLDIRKE
jgi:hypothetical protein